MNLVVTHWSANVVVLAACAVVVAAHLFGMRATAADAARAGQPRRAGIAAQAVAFYFGLLAVIVALVSPLGYWSQRYIWVRSLQDLLLALVAPGLIVLGAPWLLLARGAGFRPGRRPAGEAVPGAAPDRRAGGSPGRPSKQGRAAGGWGAGPWAPRRRKVVAGPVAVVAAVDVAWWVWHAPLLYDAALRSPLVYGAEVAVYLGLGITFWLQLIGSWPLAPRMPPLHRVMLIAATVVSDTVLAMILGFSTKVVYPGYLGLARLPVVADQQLGGAILWVLIMPPLVVTAVALLIRWLNNEESQALTAGLDRLLDSPTSAWPSRPGLR